MTADEGPMPRWTAAVASRDADEVGEGPVWDAPRNRLLWVDIDVGRIHVGSLVDDRVRLEETWAQPETCGALSVAANGDILVAGTLGTFVLAADGTRRAGTRILDGTRNQRLNDGKCDPAGRFVVGSLERRYELGREVLVRCEDDGTVTVLDEGLGLSNGLGWSPDGRTMYSVDSRPGTVWARPYDAASGAVGERRLLIAIRDGLPDGLCVDAEGHLWVAIWGRGEVRRYTPGGEPCGVVEVASPNVTCPVFAGPDLDLMVITSATQDLEPGLLAGHPDAGKVFTVRTGHRGLAATPWAGRT